MVKEWRWLLTAVLPLVLAGGTGTAGRPAGTPRRRVVRMSSRRCTAPRCSPTVVGAAWMALGVIYVHDDLQVTG